MAQGGPPAMPALRAAGLVTPGYTQPQEHDHVATPSRRPFRSSSQMMPLKASIYRISYRLVRMARLPPPERLLETVDDYGNNSEKQRTPGRLSTKAFSAYGLSMLLALEWIRESFCCK